MDESGIHDGAHVCVIAGFWGGANRWKEFAPRWTKIIENADEPALKEFHSSNFWNASGQRRGVFARWSDSKAEQFVSELIACIADLDLYPMSASLKISAWRKLNKEERMFLTGGKMNLPTREWASRSAPNKTYYLPFQFAVVYPAMACKEHLRVNYFFDLNKQFRNHATELFELMKKDENLTCRSRIGKLSLLTSEESPGLQAADLLAYQSYRYGKIRINSSQPVKGTIPPILKELLRNARSIEDFPFFDEDGLNVALQNLPTDMRSEGWYTVKRKLK